MAGILQALLADDGKLCPLWTKRASSSGNFILLNREDCTFPAWIGEFDDCSIVFLLICEGALDEHEHFCSAKREGSGHSHEGKSKSFICVVHFSARTLMARVWLQSAFGHAGLYGDTYASVPKPKWRHTVKSLLYIFKENNCLLFSQRGIRIAPPHDE